MLFGNTVYLLYNSLILPYLNYEFTVWCYTFNKYLEKNIFSKKLIIRITTFSDCNVTPCSALPKNENNDCQWSSYICHCHINLHKSRNKTPLYFTKLFNIDYTQMIDFNFNQLSELHSHVIILWNQLAPKYWIISHWTLRNICIFT